MQAPTPAPDTSVGLHDSTIWVRGCRYRFAGDVFTTWQVRQAAAAVAARTGESYDLLLGEVVGLCVSALDGVPPEAAA